MERFVNTHFDNFEQYTKVRRIKLVIHKLKIQPQYFKEICNGKKSFEIRKNDRDFKVGDKLLLQEYLSETKEYTGRVIERKITYLTNFAQQENYVVMSIK